MLFIIATIASVMHFVWFPAMLDAERDHVSESQKAVLAAMDSSMVGSLLVGNYAAIYETLNRQLSQNSSHWKQVVLKNAEGKRIFPLRKPARFQGDFVLVLHHDVLWENEIIANMELSIDWESEREVIHQKFSQMEWTLLFIFVATVMSAWLWQNYWIRKPLVQLRAAAVLLARGDYSASLPEAGSDELGELNRSFSRMRSKLEKTQIELESALALAREREVRMQTTLDNMLGGLVTIDKFGMIDSVNRATRHMFGYTEDELIGQNVSMLMTDAHSQYHDGRIDDYIRTGEARVIGVGRESVAKRKNGAEFPVDLSVSRMEIGGEMMFCGIMRDLTESKRALAAKEEAEYANDVKTKFLSVMSHELRTPLNAVLGFSQLLEMELNDEKTRGYANEITQAGNSLLELISQILDYTRIETGTLEVILEEVDLHSLVGSCLEAVEQARIDRRISIDNNIHASANYYLHVNEFRFKQVVCNILSNAIKYNTDGGSVVLDSRIVNGNRLRLSVADTGRGLTEDEIERLYLPFNRLDRVEQQAGGGIGLAISERLLAKMNGSIGCESVHGEGSVFWVDVDLVSSNPI